MKKVFLLLFVALFVALTAGAQSMPASSDETNAQAGTGITTTTARKHHRKHRKHHHHHRANSQ